MLRVAVIGTGRMARVRARAFMSALPECSICHVASRDIRNAQAFAQAFSCQQYTDDYRDVLRASPDALLIEVPHRVQDEVALWALASDLHVLIGGCLATSSATGARIARMAQERGLVVEAGYEARYKEVWRVADEQIRGGQLGAVLAIRTVAYHDSDPSSWYYDESLSGGMVVTHMSYTFLNPLRWIFGAPRRVAAFANKKHQTGADKVRHETCTANLLFADEVLCNMTASYVKPAQLQAWSVQILGTQGCLELHPGDLEPGSMTVYSNQETILTRHFTSNHDAFAEQARAFAAAIHGLGDCLNPAWDALVDLRVAEAIVRSAEQHTTVDLDSTEFDRA